MIEKFLEKFLPQITERLNENEEVGKALIEALAVLDNYATINNVQFTDEQVNTMLGVVPEPAPEPNADIPAEIVEIVEKKKRGRKPKAETTAWTWRFKTKEEFVNEFGTDWAKQISWNASDMNYLFGEEIAETKQSKEVIEELTARISSKVLDTFDVFRITSGGDNTWRINTDMLTDKPLPKVILRRGQPLTPSTQTGWSWRFKTEEELQQEWGLNRWKLKVAWSDSGKMDYLFGKPIIESDLSKQFIEDLLKSSAVSVDTNNDLGIDSGNRNIWTISEELVTNKPLPTVAAPAKSEPKKRGRKPKGTATAWSWRFKTEQEFKEEYGDDWKEEVKNWSVYGGMDYLFGEEIAETPNSRDVISLLQKGENSNMINTFRELGISSGDDDDWILQIGMLTDKPLPTAAAPTKSEPKKRGRKPKSALPEIDLGGLEDIGDIDIDAIDFDNLVI